MIIEIIKQIKDLEEIEPLKKKIKEILDVKYQSKEKNIKDKLELSKYYFLMKEKDKAFSL